MNSLFKSLFVVFFFLHVHIGYTQLSNFTLNVTSTNETCTANGVLNFSVSGIQVGSIIVYSIYLLPNTTTPVTVTSDNSQGGLVAGTYRVVATQSLGNQSGFQVAEVTIVNEITNLAYQIIGQNAVCGNDGRITVSITSRPNYAVGYEIISGPELRPIQTSNEFLNLAPGQYTIRVVDRCNNRVVQTYTLLGTDTSLTLVINSSVNISNCSSTSVNVEFDVDTTVSTGVIAYPLTVVTTTTPQTGSPIVSTSTMTEGNTFATTIPFFAAQPYAYSFRVTDRCGRMYTVSGTINNLSVNNSASIQTLSFNCTSEKILISNILSVTLTNAPTGYQNSLPENLTNQIIDNQFTSLPLSPGIYTFEVINTCNIAQTLIVEITITANPPFLFPFNVTCDRGSIAFNNVYEVILITAPTSYLNDSPAQPYLPLPYNFSSAINASRAAVLVNVPIGTYTFSAKDQCGTIFPLSVILAPTNLQPTVAINPDCLDGLNTIQIQGQIRTITLQSAPASYVGTLPQNFTSQLVLGNPAKLSLNNLPSGTYTFTATNLCDRNFASPIIVTIPIQQETSIIRPIENCGSFNVDLAYSSSNVAASTFWLQKFFPGSNDWGQPSTGILQGTNGTNSSNAILLVNNRLNLNFAFSGLFRVVKVQPIFVPGSGSPSTCFKVLKEFFIYGLPEIINVNSISCGNTFDVIVNAVGLQPLTYKITLKNNLPFLINNGFSNTFTNLEPATYNFEVTDFCNNIVNREFEINVINPLTITAVNFCPNLNASLTVPSFNFLTYRWWKNTNPTVTLSTSNTLTINNFNPILNDGTYSVSITYVGNPSSCLNTTISYTVLSADYTANPGVGSSVAYCGTQSLLNLFSLLTDNNYQTNGVWQNTTGNAVVNGSSWDSSNAIPGIYDFKYTVTSLQCNIVKDTTVSITIKEIPEAPIVSVNEMICEGQSITLTATSTQNLLYSWTGPNGFVSSQQNPELLNVTSTQNGIYKVRVTRNGCSSIDESELEVVVNPLPEFELNKDCVNSLFTLEAIPLNNSFVSNEVDYLWTGPNGFTGSENPLSIDGRSVGTYSLTITNENGCFASNSINVLGTRCFIPNAISPNGDEANELLNLTELGVAKIEIYNRWGKLVYEKNGYLNEWHGQNQQNEQLPDGTYYYIVFLNTNENKIGWIQLCGQ